MSNVEDESCNRLTVGEKSLDSDRHPVFAERTALTDSDRSLSPNDTITSVNRNSFFIDALLAKDNRCGSPSSGTNSQNTSRSASISPGSEIHELPVSSFDDMQLPNAVSGGTAGRNNMLTMTSAAAILAGHGNESAGCGGGGQLNGTFYGLYPVASSAYQPLPRMEMTAGGRSINLPGTVTKLLNPAVAGHATTMTAGHLQQMQLEWFARAGMFYAGPRLQESSG